MAVKPFCIKTKGISEMEIADAINKCIKCGANAYEYVDGIHDGGEFLDIGITVSDWAYFGIDLDNDTIFCDNLTDYGYDAEEITLDQLDEWLGLDKTETPEEKEAFDSMVNNSELPNDSGWNGEGLPPAGVECEFSCEGFWGDSDYHWCRFLGFLSDKSYAIEFHHPTSPSKVTCQCFDPQCTSFRKSETPQQREERERMEAAYDLFVAFKDASNVTGYPSLAKWQATQPTQSWLAIVDKTDYRKAK